MSWNLKSDKSGKEPKLNFKCIYVEIKPCERRGSTRRASSPLAYQCNNAATTQRMNTVNTESCQQNNIYIETTNKTNGTPPKILASLQHHNNLSSKGYLELFTSYGKWTTCVACCWLSASTFTWTCFFGHLQSNTCSTQTLKITRDVNLEANPELVSGCWSSELKLNTCKDYLNMSASFYGLIY